MSDLDSKSSQILDAALPVFIRYGFRKTTMADIARAARISRASLYLCFNSKEDLFRAGSQRAHTRTMQHVAGVLGRPGLIFDRINDAILTFQDGLIGPLSGSDNVEELFAANKELARDIEIDARNRLLSLLTDALTEAVENREIDLSALHCKPAALAALIAAAMDGIKHTHSVGADFERGTNLFIAMLKLSTQPS
jgi:AcrR family transcriptional regulator